MSSSKAQKVNLTASRVNPLIKAVDTLDSLYQKGMVDMKPGTYKSMISSAIYASAEIAKQTKRRTYLKELTVTLLLTRSVNRPSLKREQKPNKPIRGLLPRFFIPVYKYVRMPSGSTQSNLAF